MKASDVKPGDKVRALDTAPGQFTAGKEYTVRSVGTSTLSIEIDDRGSRTNGWGFERFELVKPAFKVGDRFKRTVTGLSGKPHRIVGFVGKIATIDGYGVTDTDGYFHSKSNIELGPLFAVGDKVRVVKNMRAVSLIGSVGSVTKTTDSSVGVYIDGAGERYFDYAELAPVYTSCEAAQVDNLAEEYGGGKAKAREQGYRFTAKHKPQAGDRVSIGDQGTFTVKDVSSNGEIRFTDRRHTWLLHDNASVSACTLVQAASALRIEVGKFYKTRDGRKVLVSKNPYGGNDLYPFCHETDGEKWHAVTAGGKSCINYDGSDLIAEWSDDVPLYGVSPVVASPTTAKFKVGDRVKATKDKPAGQVGTILEFNDANIYQKYLVEFDNWRDGHGGYPRSLPRNGWWLSDGEMELLPAAPTTIADIVRKHSPAIVCLIEFGQPKPSTLPFVHADKDLAATEAARLAGKHPGQEFGVYELVTTRKTAKVYPFTWQNKATQGKKIDAIKEVRSITGLTLKAAKDAVESWLASEAA